MPAEAPWQLLSQLRMSKIKFRQNPKLRPREPQHLVAALRAAKCLAAQRAAWLNFLSHWDGSATHYRYPSESSHLDPALLQLHSSARFQIEGCHCDNQRTNWAQAFRDPFHGPDYLANVMELEVLRRHEARQSRRALHLER